MPLYVLRCISTVETDYVRPFAVYLMVPFVSYIRMIQQKLIKALVQNSAATLLKQGAVVRSIQSDGIKRLPTRMKSSPGVFHDHGV